MDLVDIPQTVVLAQKGPFCITTYNRSQCVGALSPEVCKLNITFNNTVWLQYQRQNTFLHLGVGFGPMGYMGPYLPYSWTGTCTIGQLFIPGQIYDTLPVRPSNCQYGMLCGPEGNRAHDGCIRLPSSNQSPLV